MPRNLSVKPIHFHVAFRLFFWDIQRSCRHAFLQLHNANLPFSLRELYLMARPALLDHFFRQLTTTCTVCNSQVIGSVEMRREQVQCIWFLLNHRSQTLPRCSVASLSVFRLIFVFACREFPFFPLKCLKLNEGMYTFVQQASYHLVCFFSGGLPSQFH